MTEQSQTLDTRQVDEKYAEMKKLEKAIDVSMANLKKDEIKIHALVSPFFSKYSDNYTSDSQKVAALRDILSISQNIASSTYHIMNDMKALGEVNEWYKVSNPEEEVDEP